MVDMDPRVLEIKSMTDVEKRIRERLFSMQDTAYRDFCAKLTPSIEKEIIIGIRIPILRAYARELSRTEEATVFLQTLPHKYYDEYNLHGFLIERMEHFDETIEALDRFLPYVDNWATCDLCSPKVLKKHPVELFSHIKRWIASKEVYTVRFGIGMLLTNYLDEHFDIAQLDIVAEIRSDEYYINMMIAWYFATALAKQYEATLPYMEMKRLDKWTHNKAIQKAIESRRLSPEQKAHLRGLKLK